MSERIVLGIDCCGKEIVPVRDKLSMFRNRHSSCDGTSWGWIEGCDSHVCWADNKNFGSKQARELVNKWNDRAAEIKEGANLQHTTGQS
jgi:hypothetical protein